MVDLKKFQRYQIHSNHVNVGKWAILLNGEKFYSTGTSFADWIAIRALHPDGYTVFAIVDRHAAGVEVINDWNGFGQRTTASGTVKLHNVIADPALFFDERIISDTPNVRGAYSQLLQVAIDVGIAEAAFDDTLSSIRKARPIIDAGVEKPVKNITPYKKLVSSISFSMQLFYY